jgi:DNA-binding transcriptional LysR family regulator
VALTPAGEAFLPAARRCLDAAAQAAADAAAAIGAVTGRLAVGMIPTVAAVDVPAALKRFHRRHPGVEVALRTGPSNQLVKDIGDGRLDVAFLGLPIGQPPAGVRTHTLARDRHVAVVGADHPLAGRRSAVKLDRLAQETFVDFPAGRPGRAQTDLAFATQGLSRDVPFEVDAADLMAAIVGEGLAIALLPSTFARRLAGLALIPVAHGPSRVEYLAWSEFNPGPATAAFLEILEV